MAKMLLYFQDQASCIRPIFPVSWHFQRMIDLGQFTCREGDIYNSTHYLDDSTFGSFCH
jgi:hypothetical protein